MTDPPGNFHTIEDGPWPYGTTVAVWSVNDVVGGVPVGAEIDNGVAGPDGTVTFGGLTEGEQYAAFGHGGMQTFWAHADDDARFDVLEAGALNVKAGPYNATGDGTTDDTAAIQSAITAAGILGGTVYFPPGTYRTTTSLVGQSHTHLEFSAGAVIQFNGAGSDTIIEFLGTEGSNVNLTANAAVGATSVSVAAGAEAGFAAEDFVRIGSDATMGTDAIEIGEIAQVLSTTSGTITLRSPLMTGQAYNTADSAAISKITMVESPTISGQGIIRGVAGTLHRGINVDRGHNVRIEGLRFEHVSWQGIRLTDVVDATISSVFVNYANEDTGYGVSIVNACQFVNVGDSHFFQCRHPTSINQIVDRRGIPRHITIHHCTSRDNITSPVADAFDSHAAAEYINYLYNTVHDSTNSGISIECPIATVVGNTVHAVAKYGIAMNNRTDRPTSWEVRGNKVISPTDTGIRCISHAPGSAFGSSIRRVDITDNTVESPAAGGIRIESTSGVWDYKRVRIDGNTITGPASHGIYTIGLSQSSISRNHIYDMPPGISGIRCDNGTVTTITTRIRLIGNSIHYATPATVAAIRLSSALRCKVIGNDVEGATGVGGIGLQITGSGTDCIVSGNDMSDATTTFALNAANHNVYGNVGGLIRSISSGATLATLGASENDIYRITGTVAIDTIPVTGMTGRKVTLYFVGASGLNDGTGNLKLSANFIASVDDAVDLFCDGTSWFSTGLPVNN